MFCIRYCNPEYPVESKTDIDPLFLKMSPVPHSMNKLQIPRKVKPCDTDKMEITHSELVVSLWTAVLVKDLFC